MYKVIKFFTDLHDADYPYDVGDIFPREGIAVTEERLAELAGSDNKQGVPLIELEKQADEDTKPEDGAKKEDQKKEQPEAEKQPARKSASKKTSTKTAEK